jgi:hypothetical protein
MRSVIGMKIMSARNRLIRPSEMIAKNQLKSRSVRNSRNRKLRRTNARCPLKHPRRLNLQRKRNDEYHNLASIMGKY